jgi:hypothetical protein
MQKFSPTVFHSHTREALMLDYRRMTAPAIAEPKRPSFVQGYWDAFCEAHPVAANITALVGWYAAVMLVSVAAFQVLMWEVR